MKYVVFKFLGVEVPVLFPGDLLNHDNLKVESQYGLGTPVSAGSVKILSPTEVYVKGDSFSLGLKSRTEDAWLIQRALHE